MISDVNGLPIASLVTTTQLGYVGGLTSDAQTQIDGKQPLDADLTAIAGLSPTDNDIIQRKAGAWVNRTLAQVKTDLSINLVENTALSNWAGTTNITSISPVQNIAQLSNLTTEGIVSTDENGVLSVATAIPVTFITGAESVLTFADGLHRTGNTIYNLLSIGQSGGNTIRGGGAPTDGLTFIASTNVAPAGKFNFFLGSNYKKVLSMDDTREQYSMTWVMI